MLVKRLFSCARTSSWRFSTTWNRDEELHKTTRKLANAEPHLEGPFSLPLSHVAHYWTLRWTLYGRLWTMLSPYCDSWLYIIVPL